MTEYTVSQLAQEAKISVRTLHHYDAIGLLKPSSRSQAGYRFYTEEDMNRLADILFYRALGFSLKKIAQVLTDAPENRRAMLRDQKILIDEHIVRLQAMQRQLDDTIKTEEATMSTKKKLAALNGFDPDQYEAEVKERWGDTDAYKESARRTKKYSADDWSRYKKEAEALNLEMADFVKEGLPADSDRVLSVVEKMRLQIDQWFYPCSRQMHAQLGEMYVMDERFTATYESIQAGMAEFMKHATAANLEKHGEA